MERATELARIGGIAAIAIEKAPAEPLEVKGDLAFEAMEGGSVAYRNAWHRDGVKVFKQIEAKIPVAMVPNMTSLPDAVKEEILRVGLDHIHYQNQYIMLWPTGVMTHYCPSVIDMRATDWVVQ